MDLEIKKKMMKRVVNDHPRIKWGILTIASSLEIGEKLIDIKAWRSSRDTDNI